MILEPRIKELLNKRGVRTKEEIEEFISPAPQKTYDPFLLLNMEAGVDQILSAIDSGGRICIYGDYDADGITSVIVLTEILSQLTDNLTYYIPSRFGEGYGLNMSAIDKIRADGVDLIITVDCGSVSCDEVEHAKALGMGIVVTDHHTVTDKKADCVLINPAQEECPYPFKKLAGCGVAFKLAQALAAVTGLPRSLLTATLDLVAIGTVADIVPLVDENRTLVKYGLRLINASNRKNLNDIVLAAGLRPGSVGSENIAFGIAPRINSAGRLAHAKIAAEMFLTKDSARAGELVSRMIALNEERKSIQDRIYRECLGIIEQRFVRDNFLLIDLETEQEGVTGIVAGKITEKYYKPSVIVSRISEDRYKGTGRSIEGFNLYSVLKENEEMFITFGGHAAACGFTMGEEHVTALRKNLNETASAIRAEDPEIFTEKHRIDLFLEAEDISMELIRQMAVFEPCGCENEKPQVAFEASAGRVRRIGSEGQYLRFDAGLSDFRRVGCVAFRNADEIEDLIRAADGRKIRIIGELEINSWQGRDSIQMQVKTAERIH